MWSRPMGRRRVHIQPALCDFSSVRVLLQPKLRCSQLAFCCLRGRGMQLNPTPPRSTVGSTRRTDGRTAGAGHGLDRSFSLAGGGSQALDGDTDSGGESRADGALCPEAAGGWSSRRRAPQPHGRSRCGKKDSAGDHRISAQWPQSAPRSGRGGGGE